MRHTSKLGVGIVAVLTSWIAVNSVEGQIGLQPSAPPAVKKGHLIIAGTKEYELIADLPEVEGKFRSFDPDKSLIKFRVEYEHPDKDHKNDFDNAQKTYRDKLKNFHDRYNNLQNDYRAAMSVRNPNDKNNRLKNYQNQMESLNTDKRNADQEYKDNLNKMGLIRDVIDYELLVDKDAPIRKLWSPKLFDDKGKVRTELTKEERLKYKGPDSKLAGWTTKLEVFELNTPVKLKIRQGMSKDLDLEPETVNSQTPTPPPPPGPNPAAPAAKDDPAMAKNQEMKLEDRPVVKMVIAENDPDPNAAPVASKVGIKTK
jgi:hypothetical protein